MSKSRRDKSPSPAPTAPPPNLPARPPGTDTSACGIGQRDNRLDDLSDYDDYLEETALDDFLFFANARNKGKKKRKS